MGEFLSLAGVVHSNPEEVVSALETYAQSKGGSLLHRQVPMGEDGTLIVGPSTVGTVVMFPDDFLEWDEASAFLSRQLEVPVFSFHLHDGDLWMFILFSNGDAVGRFNPIPDYWEEDVSEEELESWKGDAPALAKYVPHVSAVTIEKYLVRWNLDDDDPGRAYPDDRFAGGDAWQLCDFMRRLGLEYPIDDVGGIKGETYELRLKS